MFAVDRFQVPAMKDYAHCEPTSETANVTTL